jgi:hypothetical protein
MTQEHEIINSSNRGVKQIFEMSEGYGEKNAANATAPKHSSPNCSCALLMHASHSQRLRANRETRRGNFVLEFSLFLFRQSL